MPPSIKPSDANKCVYLGCGFTDTNAFAIHVACACDKLPRCWEAVYLMSHDDYKAFRDNINSLESTSPLFTPESN